MKLILVLALCAQCALATAAAAPKTEEKLSPFEVNAHAHLNPESRNILINALIRQLFNYIRFVINNGSNIFGVPVLDPLNIEHYHLVIPAGLINLDLELYKVLATGIGGFVVNSSRLEMSTLTFDLDITVPNLDISAEDYDFIGDFFTAIPLYGKGKATFKIENFNFKAKLFLKQSEDLRSILIDRVEDASFVIPSFKSGLTGVIGGGDIDAIVNAMVEEVIIDYVNRFSGAISRATAHLAPLALNPMLDQLDTWRFIAPFVPRN